MKRKTHESTNRIGFFPAGDILAASSRIRVYSMLPHLQSMKIFAAVKPSLWIFLALDTIFIQKRVTRKIIIKARIAKLLGKKIIYDIDDFGSALEFFTSEVDLRRIIKLADMITTGTENQKQILKSIYPSSRISVLPSLIDYFPTNYVYDDQKANGIFRIIWFGMGTNFFMFEKYIEAIQKIESIEIIVVINQEMLDSLSKKYTHIHFFPWTLDTFTQILRSCHISIFTHEGSLYDRAKTNNKMIASITWGVPAIVSNTPDYLSTAQKAGVEYAVFSTSTELTSIIELLRSPEERKKYLQKAQPIIWQEYSPAVITERFLQIRQQTKTQSFYFRLKAILSSFLNL